jgi:hypothetical protein
MAAHRWRIGPVRGPTAIGVLAAGVLITALVIINRSQPQAPGPAPSRQHRLRRTVFPSASGRRHDQGREPKGCRVIQRGLEGLSVIQADRLRSASQLWEPQNPGS